MDLFAQNSHQNSVKQLKSTDYDLTLVFTHIIVNELFYPPFSIFPCKVEFSAKSVFSSFV